MPPLRIAVLLSGAGTSLENLLLQTESGRLDEAVRLFAEGLLVIECRVKIKPT